MITYLPINTFFAKSHPTLVIPVLITLLCFVIYWFTAHCGKIKEWFYHHNESDTASVYHFLFTKISGFLIMGIMPLVSCLILMPQYSWSFYALTFRADTSLFSLIWIVAISAILIPVASLSARKPKNLVNYPQIRAKVWTIKTVMINIIGWSLYLLGYELLFRGVLLMPLAEQLGIWPAISINIALYSATHIPKGLEETLGAIPLGILLCLLTLASGTIWIAFFAHLAMALTNCFTALKFHPEFHYKNRKSHA